MSIVRPDGTPAAGLVGTGHVVQLMNGETIAKTYTVLLYGDANGDGRINAIDSTIVVRHMLNQQPIDGDMLIAADANRDGRINAIDVTMIIRHFLRVMDLNQ